jgi:hypothetical protein
MRGRTLYYKNTSVYLCTHQIQHSLSVSRKRHMWIEENNGNNLFVYLNYRDGIYMQILKKPIVLIYSFWYILTTSTILRGVCADKKHKPGRIMYVLHEYDLDKLHLSHTHDARRIVVHRYTSAEQVHLHCVSHRSS